MCLQLLPAQNIYMELFEYLEQNFDFDPPVILAGDFNNTERTDCISGAKSTYLYNTYARFINSNNITQHNNILNANGRILDLIITTNHISAEIRRHEEPLVIEDLHHPCLDIIVSLS